MNKRVVSAIIMGCALFIGFNTYPMKLLKTELGRIGRKLLGDENLLYRAIKNNEVDKVNSLVKKFMKKRRRLSALDFDGTPLHLAAELGKTEIIENLLNDPEIRKKLPVDIENYGFYGTKSCRSMSTPLQVAARAGQLEAVTTLLKYGADINKKDLKGFTALDYAFLENKSKIIQTLLEKGTKSEKYKKVVTKYLEEKKKQKEIRKKALPKKKKELCEKTKKVMAKIFRIKPGKITEEHKKMLLKITKTIGEYCSHKEIINTANEAKEHGKTEIAQKLLQYAKKK